MTEPETIAKGITLHPGDCLDVLAQLAEHSVDSCVTDPPYHLTSIVKRFGAENAAPAKAGKTGAYARASAGFMGKQWDGGDVAFRPETWAAVFRVLKPGGHLIAFSGTRTYHRMAVAIEDAGFEIRDQIGWAYGSGFPKSHNAGDGWGTALKPAWEPVVLARKPLIGTVAQNVLEHGTGAINIDGCRVPSGQDHAEKCASVVGLDSNRTGDVYGAWSGTRADSYSPAGRWPANLIHDGSAEVIEAFPESGPSSGKPRNNGDFKSVSKGHEKAHVTFGHDDAGGSAARFFYTAKADADDRIGSKHPTVKPVDLMQWLVRLVTPAGGLVLDPFAGTGTTGEAAFREGMRAILIEREAEYQDDIRRRMKLALAGPDERRRESIKAKTKDEPQDAGPLFSEWDAMWSHPFVPEKR
jgi:site-specific DNA-methyltransferase (adenine-specific)